MVAGSRRSWSATTCRTGRWDLSLGRDFEPREFGGVGSHILSWGERGRLGGVRGILRWNSCAWHMPMPAVLQFGRGRRECCRHPTFILRVHLRLSGGETKREQWALCEYVLDHVGYFATHVDSFQQTVRPGLRQRRSERSARLHHQPRIPRVQNRPWRASPPAKLRPSPPHHDPPDG